MEIQRLNDSIVTQKLEYFSAVGLIGARQTGKTTLALAIAASRPSIYLDLEDPRDLAKLSDPANYLSSHEEKLIIIDEVQLKPELFQVLRGHIDRNRRAGRKYGQLLILGSASVDLLRQSSETLAGRICYVEMSPILLPETKGTDIPLNDLWLRGGYPDSLLSANEAQSVEWRTAFIRTYLERDIPLLGPKIPAETLRRFWTMIAHSHGELLNASRLSGSLGVSGQTITRYIDLFVDLFLVRRLSPWHANLGKRLVRSPKVYLRDSGVLHALLNLTDRDALLGSPAVGASWEGFVIDNIMGVLPERAETFFYRTARGAEVDLVIKHPDGRIFAIEIKLSSAPKVQRGFYEGCKDIGATDRFVIYIGNETYPFDRDIIASPLSEFLPIVGGGP